MSYKCNEMAGREFKSVQEGYRWFMLTYNQSTVFCKMTDMNFALALEHKSFEIWHMTILTPQGGIAPLCVATKTVEPWAMGSFTALAIVHDDLASELEKAYEEMTRSIQVAHVMPKGPIPGKKIELVRE